MKLMVGLGNPGTKYAGNRHNIGFRAVEAIAEAHGFGPWRARFQGMTSEGRLGAEKVLLLKPETFMNLSGDAVRAAMAFYKITPGDVIAFHDELDLAPGRLRVKTGGGHAGHNGLRSIATHIGTDFTRVRIGIGHPGEKHLVSPYVLGDFAKADVEWINPLLRAIAECAPTLASGDGSRFMNAVATHAASEPEPKPSPRGPDTPDERSPLQKLMDRFR